MTGGSLGARVVVERRGGFRVDVALAAAPGETVAIMGPSGAGKSTLLAAIAGLTVLDDGGIRIDDREVASPAARVHVAPAERRIGLLGQDPHLFPHLTVRENIAFGPRAHGVDRKEARAQAEEWLARVGLEGMGGERPSHLSGGQQQRVALARALATEPRVLLLDEPLTALDAETAGEIRALLHDQLASVQATAVIVSHDAVDAVALARRLMVIEDGRITQHGPVRDVLALPATRFVAAATGMNRVLGVARDGGWAIDEHAFPLLRGATPTQVADRMPLAALFRPSAVSLHRVEDPATGRVTASARHSTPPRTEPGTWTATVTRLEQTLAGVRVHTAEPGVAVDVPTEAVADLDLAPGVPVRLRVDHADVRLTAAAKS